MLSLSYRDGVCYREREGKSIPLPFFIWINRHQDWPLKWLVKKGTSYPHYMPCSLLNERSLGQSSGRGKVGRLIHRLSAPKRPSRVREIWRRIFSLVKPAIEPDRWGQPAPGKTPTCKQEKRNLKIENPSKINTTQTVFLLQFLNIGKLYELKKRKKL